MEKQQYIYDFKKYTNYQFNNHFKNGKTKNKIMSFYSYLATMSDKKEINITKKEITRLWNRKQSKTASKNQTKYKKVASTTVLRWLLKLEKAKLLFVKRDSNNNNIYMLNEDGSITSNFFKSKKCTEKCTSKKEVETIDTTNTDVIENVHKYKNINTSTKDLDTNSCFTPTESANNFDYKNYINSNKKVDSWDYMNKLLNQAFKILKVRSTYIKNSVISKVYNYYANITKKHAMQYVCNCISSARERNNCNYKKYVLDNCDKTIDSFNNYEQRSYDFNKLEKGLLGWD